jgi:hypothetical protein
MWRSNIGGMPFGFVYLQMILIATNEELSFLDSIPSDI